MLMLKMLICNACHILANVMPVTFYGNYFLCATTFKFEDVFLLILVTKDERKNWRSPTLLVIVVCLIENYDM